MRKLVAITALVCGALYFMVPRYILPACEYAGYPRMLCSNTAQAEYVVGALLILTGCMTLVVKSGKTPLAGAVLSGILFGLAFWLPNAIGYCRSPGMPCNYGMAPAIRFLSGLGLLIMIGAVLGIAKSRGKKGNS